MTGIERLVEDLERSYTEAQERMSDPAVYNDRREAAEIGRRLKELEGAHKLAQEWRETRSDLDAASSDGDLKELVPELEERLAGLEEELKLAMVETDPADRKDVIVEIRQGVGGDEAALWASDVYRMLTRYAERRGFKTEMLGTSPNEAGGVKDVLGFTDAITAVTQPAKILGSTLGLLGLNVADSLFGGMSESGNIVAAAMNAVATNPGKSTFIALASVALVGASAAMGHWVQRYGSIIVQFSSALAAW